MSKYYAINEEILVDIANATREKTGETDGILAEDIAGKIREITSGIELPELTDEGSASDLLSGKELIDQEGNVVTGTFTIDDELTAQDNLISQIQNAVDNLPEAGNNGSSSNDIETYTGTIIANNDLSDAYIVYTDKNLILQETRVGMGINSVTVEVPKNTAIVIDAPGGASADIGCADLIGYGCAYHITANNFVITVD